MFTCGEYGDKDGALKAAKIQDPDYLTHYKTSCTERTCQQFYYYDKGQRKLKRIWYLTENGYYNYWFISTARDWRLDTRGMGFDLSANYLYMAYEKSIERINMKTNQTEFLIIEPDYGYNDGPFADASASLLLDLAFITDDLFVIADYTNSILRVFDISTRTVSSICQYQTEFSELFDPGSIRYCHMRKPRSITVSTQKNGGLYVITGNYIYHIGYSSMWKFYK
ncbi:hypothetical protein EB796_020034 [Bugula neritina]|uniref:Uncharacterized protein n=1 Tax=Bugula neritina TaxID=10212 RepID=A0A7J7J6V6_BUGNE|nr:hypothetical protein EB796_020034 [Bugula neritina]